MFSVYYQIIYNKEPDFTELINILKESFEEYLELDDYAIHDIIDFEYAKNLDETPNSIIVGFKLSFDETYEDFIGDVLDSFNNQLKDYDDVSAVFKFYDDILFNNLKKCYYKIFKLEMKLREILTFIFIDTYQNDYYDLLKDITINPHYEDREIEEDNKFSKKTLLKDKIRREDYLSTFLENEFFYFTFSEYKNVSNLNNLKNNDLIDIINYSDSYDEFKKNLLKRGVTDKDYKKILKEIYEYVDGLSSIRNCIAHIRTPSDWEVYQLNHFIMDIDRKIEEFKEIIIKKT